MLDMEENDLSAKLQAPLGTVLVDRAARDEAFRKQLLDQPREALAELLGAPVPSGVRIQTHEDTGSVMNVVLDAGALALQEAVPGGGGPIAKAMRKALEDKSFRQRLQSQPAQAVKEATDIDLPAGTQLNVYENTPTEFHLVVPARVAAEGELSDSQLESVAGGKLKPCPINVTTLALGEEGGIRATFPPKLTKR